MTEGSRTPTISIRCGHVFDGRSDTLQRDQDILVAHDRIAAIGPRGQLQCPPELPTIDLTGCTVLPGFIDAHTHVIFHPGNYPEILGLRESIADLTVWAVANAKATLEAGFTTIRDVGARGYVDIALREAVRRGLVPGPRMFVSGHSLSITGGHGDMNSCCPEVVAPGLSAVVDGVDAVRRAVREQFKYGADWIKIFATGGVLSYGDQPGAQHFSFEEMRVAVEEANRAGRLVAAHAHGTEGIKAAIRAGVRSIEHGSYLDDEAIELMLKHGVYLVPTLFVVDSILERAHELRIHAEGLEKCRRLAEAQRKSFRRALQAGIPIAFGTDAGIYPHGGNAGEFVSLVREGMSPGQAIRAATAVAAKLLRAEDDLGTVEAGKYADLVAVRANPLQDVTTLRCVDFVMKGGRVYRSSDHVSIPPSALMA